MKIASWPAFSRGRGRGRKLFVALNVVLLALAGVVLVPAFVLADVPGSYTSYGFADGVHAIGSSDAFPNFQNGAVNNRYPMSEVQQDASPSSTAVATYFDSGPAAATGGSQYNQSCAGSGNQPPPPQICQNPNNQVPYAKATYPGGPDHSHIDACNGQNPCPAGGADTDAGQLNAGASGYYAGGASAQQPFSGASSWAKTVMDSGGTLTVTTHSEVQSWSMGPVQVGNTVVDVTATSTISSAGGDAHITGGQVTFQGHPLSVTDQGVTVENVQPVPCSSIPKPPVPNPVPAPAPPSAPSLLPGLPGAPTGGSSGSSGASGGPSGGSSSAPSTCVPGVDITYFKFYTVAPTKTFDGSHATVWATGLHIVVTHPSPGAGVPTQSAEYVLGEGFADTTAGTGGAGGGPGGLGGGFGDFGGGFGGGLDNGLGSGAPGGLAGVGAALAANRVPLAFMFLTLEALLLASAAAWVWARNTPVDRVPDEVLSP